MRSWIKRVLFVTQDEEEIGRGGSIWANPNTDGHNFYDEQSQNVGDKYLFLFGQIHL